MTELLFPAWRDHNSITKYPFEDTTSLTTDEGLVLPNGVIVDAILYPACTDALSLTYVDIDAVYVTLYVGNEAYPTLCYGTFTVQDPPTNLAMYNELGQQVGMLVAGTQGFELFQSWDFGRHTFTWGSATFVASACVPYMASGVQGIATEDGDVVSGDVWIIAENGIVLTESLDDDQPDDVVVIRVDVVGDPMFRRTLCGDQTTFTTPVFLKTINGIAPNTYGDFKFVVGHTVTPDTALRISPTDGGLVIGIASKAATR